MGRGVIFSVGSLVKTSLGKSHCIQMGVGVRDRDEETETH